MLRSNSKQSEESVCSQSWKRKEAYGFAEKEGLSLKWTSEGVMEY